MILPATIIERTRKNVEISKDTLLRHLVNAYKKAYKVDFWLLDANITINGELEHYAGDNHHNGNPEYEILRLATESDKFHIEWVNRLRNALDAN